ncbi:hypothetical protein GCM10008949_45050 [Deinococcus humi]|nr:hypothetical protein GCM10008949_45050 [Deinococcus humi]
MIREFDGSVPPHRGHTAVVRLNDIHGPTSWPPDFAHASFCRLDFTRDGVRHVLDFKID